MKYNENNNSGNWHNQFSDHTYPGDKNRGYMFMTNADASPNRIMYKNKIKGLCGGKISVSLWAANLNNKPETQTPTFRIELTDSVNMVVAAYVTTSFADFSSPSWKSYGFEVDIPASYDSLNLFIYPNTTGSDAGNDFVFDDVEIRICLPKVNISQPAGSDTIVCAGSSITFNGSYNDGSGVSTPVAKWLYSKTGNINNPDEWADVGSAQTGSGGVVNNNLTISPTTVDTAGYYRLVAADAANINKANCRSMSRVIHLTVTKGYIPPDIRVYVKPDAGTVHLSSYINTPSAAQ